MKNKKYWGLIILSLMPMMVYAEDKRVELFSAIFMEAFISIHMSLFVLMPIAKMLKPENYKSLFWKMFGIRAGILLFFDFFITTNIVVVDFFAVFICALFVVPIISAIKNAKATNNDINLNVSNVSTPVTPENSVVLKCANCGNVMKVTDNFCTNCGKPFADNNVVVSNNPQANLIPKQIVNAYSFDAIYNLKESLLVEEFVIREMNKAQIDITSKMMPKELVKRKKILNIIFSLLLFIYISLIFFHFPFYTYILGLIILIVYAILTNKMNIVKYVAKQVKARPNEKISNIVMSIKENLIVNNSKNIFIFSLLIAIILPLIIFYKPHSIYDHTNDGYVLRFYSFGLTNFKEVTVPKTYKGKDVVGLRGNAFSNMFFLEKVTLPDTIKEIRGEAFANDVKLKEINMPTSLQYLGGGAFYGCSSLKELNMPDTLSYIGGEAFYGCSSLRKINLPTNLKEIRGNTFEDCTSLKAIEIPDNVTRIGGHAFYRCHSLAEVKITENSKLNEIGSSAFRLCSNLDEITLPKTTYVNSRAFKESPTIVHRYGEEYINNYDDYYNSNSNYYNSNNNYYNSNSNNSNSNNNYYNSNSNNYNDISTIIKNIIMIIRRSYE